MLAGLQRAQRDVEVPGRLRGNHNGVDRRRREQVVDR
jgi:hypothetical protein